MKKNNDKEQLCEKEENKVLDELCKDNEEFSNLL